MELDVGACTKRNIHHRSEIEIERLVAGWEATPSHYLTLDATSLIQAGCISDVEMEEVATVSDEDDKDGEFEVCLFRESSFGVLRPCISSQTLGSSTGSYH